MEVDPKLIFDVGVCDGRDTAYYLHKGFRVVAVEASPAMIPQLRKRFRAEIEDGRLVLVPMAIAEQEGEAPFWVCDDWPHWSSFDRSMASLNGSRHHEVMVPTCNFRSLLERFGIPFYCKVDIEGSDNLCLEALDGLSRPTFVSVEVGDGNTQIRLLRDLGYSRFKLISQTTLRQPTFGVTRFKAALPRWARSLFVRLEARAMRARKDGDWRFVHGVSGPFGEGTHGPWLTAEEAIELNALTEKAADFAEWFDIHAAIDEG